jgi:hypothetical protein
MNTVVLSGAQQGCEHTKNAYKMLIAKLNGNKSLIHREKDVITAGFKTLTYRLNSAG